MWPASRGWLAASLPSTIQEGTTIELPIGRLCGSAAVVHQIQSDGMAEGDTGLPHLGIGDWDVT